MRHCVPFSTSLFPLVISVCLLCVVWWNINNNDDDDDDGFQSVDARCVINFGFKARPSQAKKKNKRHATYLKIKHLILKIVLIWNCVNRLLYTSYTPRSKMRVSVWIIPEIIIRYEFLAFMKCWRLLTIGIHICL